MKLAAGLLITGILLVGCGPRVDPELKAFVGNHRDTARFLKMSVDDQIEVYLRVAALPLKPPDYSLSGVIATKNGDIGAKIAERLVSEHDAVALKSLLRLAGDYCDLNPSCAGQEFLETAARTGYARLPTEMKNEYTQQSLDWVSRGVGTSRAK